MADKQIYSWQFDIHVPREALWEFVSDTERINRLAGLFRVHYDYEPLPTGGSVVRAKAKAHGFTFSWVEKPCEWVRPERFQFRREYDRGPLTLLLSRCELQAGESADSTRLVQTLEAYPRNALYALACRYAIGVEAYRGFAKAYAAALEWYATKQWPVLGSERPKPSAECKRVLKDRLLPLAAQLGSIEPGKHLVEYLLGQPDSSVAVLYPYRLADRWKVSRKQTLTLLLHATRMGMFDLHWNLICPSCRRSKVAIATLKELTQTGHCDACNLNFSVEFDRCVEVTFSPAPLGLGSHKAEYCHAGPMNTPHRLASQTIADGDNVRLEADMPPGKYRVLSPQTKGGVLCEARVSEDVPPEASCELTANGIYGLPLAVRAGRVVWHVRNGTGMEAQCLIENAQWADTSATAADVTAMAEFRDLFGSQVLAPGANFAIQNLTFLFSDLVESTALYDRIGDAPAFSLVRDHFELLKSVYSQFNGTLVKTIGDSVMAAFKRPEDALMAAIRMHENIPALKDMKTGVVLRLRIGLHCGPCIAVEANGVLDYFGSTVNTAARVEQAAGAGELVFSNTLLRTPRVESWVRARVDRDAHGETLSLKGISAPVQIFRLNITPGARENLAALTDGREIVQ